MSYGVVAFYIALHAVYLAVGLGQVSLVAWKLYEQETNDKRSLRRKGHSDKKDVFARFNGYALFTCCCFASIRALLMVLGFSRAMSCDMMFNLGTTIFQLFKMLMYLVFIFRAQVIYEGTPFAYNKKMMKGAAIGVVVFNLAVTVMWAVQIDGYRKSEGTLSTCGTTASVLVLAPTMAQDFILSFVFLHLFTRPLKQLEKQMVATEKSQSERMGSSKYSTTSKQDSAKEHTATISAKDESAKSGTELTAKEITAVEEKDKDASDAKVEVAEDIEAVDVKGKEPTPDEATGKQPTPEEATDKEATTVETSAAKDESAKDSTNDGMSTAISASTGSKPSKATLMSSTRSGSSSSSSKHRRDDGGVELRRVAVKCAVVTWMAVATTLLNLFLVGRIGFLQLIVLDLLVNNTCMMFMTSWFDAYFSCVCAPPLAVARCCHCLCGDIPQSFTKD